MLCVEMWHSNTTRARAFLKPSQPFQCGHALFGELNTKTENTKQMQQTPLPLKTAEVQDAPVKLCGAPQQAAKYESRPFSHANRPPGLTHAHPASSGSGAWILASRARSRDPLRAIAPAAPVARHFLPDKEFQCLCLNAITTTTKTYVRASII